MKLRSLLAGSAALLVIGSAAYAVTPAPAPVEYVRVCDAFGAGYFYIPGTETCLKIGGSVRVESSFVFPGDDANFRAFTDRPLDDFNQWNFRARGTVSFDARTQTDIGLIEIVHLARRRGWNRRL